MAGELSVQLFNITGFWSICPALNELEAIRRLSPECHAVLREAAASPFISKDLAELLHRILRHPELELRVFLTPRELDEVISVLVHVLCFANGAERSLVTLVGPNWVVLDGAFAAFMDLDWFQAIFINTCSEAGQLPYPKRGEDRYRVLSREELARLAAGVQPMLKDPLAARDVRSAAEGLARLATEALSQEDLTLAHVSLL